MPESIREKLKKPRIVCVEDKVLGKIHVKLMPASKVLNRPFRPKIPDDAEPAVVAAAVAESNEEMLHDVVAYIYQEDGSPTWASLDELRDELPEILWDGVRRMNEAIRKANSGEDAEKN